MSPDREISDKKTLALKHLKNPIDNYTVVENENLSEKSIHNTLAPPLPKRGRRRPRNHMTDINFAFNIFCMMKDDSETLYQTQFTSSRQ